jgi:hypothetical protein
MQARLFFPALLAAASAAHTALADGDGSFQAPFRIRTGHPVAVAAGDFNRDGRLDLAAADGTGGIAILLQDPSDRETWTRSDLAVGGTSFFVRALDWDGDGGRVDLSDAVSTLGWLFLGSSPLPPPGPRTCGPDPTPDDLPPCTTTC